MTKRIERIKAPAEDSPKTKKVPATEAAQLRKDVETIAEGLNNLTKAFTESRTVTGANQKSLFKELHSLTGKVTQLEKVIPVLNENLQRLREKVSYAEGFRHGGVFMVREAEALLMKQMGFTDRTAFVNSGQLPGYWIATLIKCLDEPPEVKEGLSILKSTKNVPQEEL